MNYSKYALFAEQNIQAFIRIQKQQKRLSNFQEKADLLKLYEYSNGTNVSTDHSIANLEAFASKLPKNTIFDYITVRTESVPDYRTLRIGDVVNSANKINVGDDDAPFVMKITQTKDFSKPPTKKLTSIFKQPTV